MLTLVTGLSLLRNLLGLELLHLGLQRLLKVGLTLPVLLQNQPYKLGQAAHYVRGTWLPPRPCPRRYMAIAMEIRLHGCSGSS